MVRWRDQDRVAGERALDKLTVRERMSPDPAPDAQGKVSQHLIRSTVFKNAVDEQGNHDSAGAERDMPWVAIRPVVNAIRVLERMVTKAFEQLRTHPAFARWQVGTLHGIQRAVAALGHCDPPSMAKHGSMPAIEGTHARWVDWIERWYATSTLTPKVRGIFRGAMAKAGRWLAAEHPEIIDPGQWTRQTCAAWVAAVDRMLVGDYIQRAFGLSKRSGNTLSPRTKAVYLTATRTVFRDMQGWEWIPRRFDPTSVLATPRSALSLIGPNPRVIADDIWAKLLTDMLTILDAAGVDGTFVFTFVTPALPHSTHPRRDLTREDKHRPRATTPRPLPSAHRCPIRRCARPHPAE